MRSSAPRRSARRSRRARAASVVDAVAELRIPDRRLYLLDGHAHAIVPDSAPRWVVVAATRALRDSSTFATVGMGGDDAVRLYAQTFESTTPRRYVAVAVADQVELEHQYAALIVAFGAAALGALLLFAAGGSFLTGKSMEPVARTMDYMRRFMADAAHELRTPLTVLRSRAEVTLARDGDSASYREALVAIEQEATRLGRIVEDLLLLARSESGALPVKLVPVFLDDIASDATGAAHPLAERKGVTLTLASFEEAQVRGDAALLHQLVMIIIDNAIKFTPAGGSVSVSITSGSDGATLAVSDSGIGIPRDQLNHVFERFFRGDAARSRSEGAGLGLSIAKWIADVHHARITVESESGGGTVVSVRFPPFRSVMSS